MLIRRSRRRQRSAKLRRSGHPPLRCGLRELACLDIEVLVDNDDDVNDVGMYVSLPFSLVAETSRMVVNGLVCLWAVSCWAAS